MPLPVAPRESTCNLNLTSQRNSHPIHASNSLLASLAVRLVHVSVSMRRPRRKKHANSHTDLFGCKLGKPPGAAAFGSSGVLFLTPGRTGWAGRRRDEDFSLYATKETVISTETIQERQLKLYTSFYF